ncbi:MAG: hypothetical protein ACYC69_01365 [Thermodesulfovibrionales bacterium]
MRDNRVTLLSARDGEKKGEESDMLRGIWTVVAVSFMVLLFSMPAQAAESKGKPAGKEDIKAVTAAMNDLTKACKAKDKEKVKKFLTKAAVADVKKDPSTLDMFMAMCADSKINKNTKFTLDGNTMTIETVTKDKTGTMTETTQMVKEDGQWKAGK